MAYSVRSREEGRGPSTVRKFKTLVELQTYVRDRWEGLEYIDGPCSWHNDYCTFEMSGATLAELGHRLGQKDTYEYWTWVWKQLGEVAK
jgi:hypothetical protein